MNRVKVSCGPKRRLKVVGLRWYWIQRLFEECVEPKQSRQHILTAPVISCNSPVNIAVKKFFEAVPHSLSCWTPSLSPSTCQAVAACARELDPALEEPRAGGWAHPKGDIELKK